MWLLNVCAIGDGSVVDATAVLPAVVVKEVQSIVCNSVCLLDDLLQARVARGLREQCFVIAVSYNTRQNV